MSKLVSDKTRSEIERRRTFAIISHPDAGKTTITEKFLLYSGSIREAGAVKGKSGAKAVSSDWMAIERERGISVTSSVVQFDYKGKRLNLLDTPGHKDFSEDTYRTLMAADSAVMMLNNSKGVEPQTRKLFEVCKLRSIPIFTFINKMDRDGMEGLELLDNIEKELGIHPIPMTWPLGMGKQFKGVYHLQNDKFHLFENVEHGSQVAAEKTYSKEDPELKNSIDEDLFGELIDEIELVGGAGTEWDQQKFIEGKITPVFFGSALNNFGIAPFLDYFHEASPSPVSRTSSVGDEEREVDPYDSDFSAFVFKIQANMDKSHRDRIAFMRVCSGEFEAGSKAKHFRLAREVRVARPQQFMGKDREVADRIVAGDIIGVHDPGIFRIGDTLSGSGKIRFSGIPQFSPEIFRKVMLKNPLKRKHLQKGLKELCEEGTVQLFVDPRVGDQDPILGAVGVLQFDVLLHRLNSEYGADAKLVNEPWTVARWVQGDEAEIKKLANSGKGILVRDQTEHWVNLFKTQWDFNWIRDKFENLNFTTSMER
jgi:peptide chain release factor 3